MSSIFISYRRQDSAAQAGRIYDRLVAEFGDGQVFMDVDSIAPGTDFIEVLEKRMGASISMLVVIGPRWLSVCDQEGASRLKDPHDIVRQEVIEGLDRGIRLIPILVDGAPMPQQNELPPELAALARRQAVVITNRHFHRDVDELISSLRALVSATSETLDITGEWAATVQSRSGHGYRIEMTIEQLQNRLYGLVRYPTGEAGILEGAIDGGDLSFKTEHVPQFEQEPAIINFQGSIAGKEIEFVMQSRNGFTKFLARKRTP